MHGRLVPLHAVCGSQTCEHTAPVAAVSQVCDRLSLSLSTHTASSHIVKRNTNRHLPVHSCTKLWQPHGTSALAPPSHLHFSGRHSAPTFVDMPLDVFLNICEWLSVRDMLALRMVNKHQICVEA